MQKLYRFKTTYACQKMMNKKKVQTIQTVKDIQFTEVELNNHVGWTTEIIYLYVNKAGHVYINFHTGLGGKYNQLCSFK